MEPNTPTFPPSNPSTPPAPPNPPQPPQPPQPQPQWHDPTTFQPGPGAGPGAPSPTAPLPGSVTPPAPMLTPAPRPQDLHPKKSKKLPVIGGILAALIVVLAGASAVAYFALMNKPQNVLNMALVHTFSPDTVQSVAFNGKYDFTPKGSGAMSGSFEGAFDDDSKLRITGKFDALVTNVTFDVRSVDDQSLYLRLGGLNGLAEIIGQGNPDVAAVASPVISAVNDKWVEINASMMRQLTGTDTNISSQLSDKDRQKISDAYKEHQFLVVDKALKDEKIGATECYHYQLVIDGPELKGFFTALKAANIKSLKIDDDSLRDFNKEVDKTDFTDYPVQIWITKGDKLIKQTTLEVTDKTSGDKVAIRFTIDAYNQPVKVERPEGAKSLLELMSQLLQDSDFSGFTGSTDSLQDLGSGISL